MQHAMTCVLRGVAEGLPLFIRATCERRVISSAQLPFTRSQSKRTHQQSFVKNNKATYYTELATLHMSAFHTLTEIMRMLIFGAATALRHPLLLYTHTAGCAYTRGRLD